MGGCFSVSLSCDQVVNQASQWLCLKWSYVHNLSENLESLDKAMGRLKAKRDNVQERVNGEEFTGQRRKRAQVQVWLNDILNIENEYNDLLSNSKRELERLCLCSFCSKNLKLSYRYGKRVAKMSKMVESLSCQGEFDVVTEAAPMTKVEELPIEPTIVGQETMLERVWNRLMDDKVRIVGLYGMGGVGKTTLLTQINNKFLEISGKFDVIIWVVVSKNATVWKIQGDIGEKLGLYEKEWDDKTDKQRALDIHNVLKRKKFVLLLDDIWEKVNLTMIGVPYPNRESGSKVAFTTRSRDVCGRMGVDDPIEVRCLDPEKSWVLFRNKVGENTMRSHPDIQELAKEVVKKCRGLPLALNVIGETMSCKTTVQEWRQAINVLSSAASDFPNVEDEILLILKYSYDSLNGEQMKSCFLYCSLFPEDYSIKKERLIEYWISEGFIDEKEDIKKAYDQGYGIIGILVRACLLLEEIEYNVPMVKMHDVVRDMALWIASDLGKHKEKWIVKGGLGLREVPKVKDWRSVQRLSLMKNDIEKISESVDCPELTTLLLGENRFLATIPGEFFRCMPMLVVLDLSWNTSLRGLPEEISRLVSLRYLDLSWTRIERLHLEKLKMLIHLNLECTEELESLQGISHLSSLRTLKLGGSKVWLDMSLMKEVQLLEHLEFITVTIITSSLVGEKILNDSRVWRCIEKACISGRQGESVRVINMPAMENLREVFIIECKKMEEIKIEKRGGWNKSLTSPCLFSNLSHVIIQGCDGLKDLTWLLFAPNLTSLKVVASEKIKEIISEEKAASLLEKGTDIIPPFQKLEFLELLELPELMSIYWNALPFPRLRRFIITKCPKVRKLPLDSKSVDKVEDLKIQITGYKEEGIERFEWEDEATRQRFMGNFTRSRVLSYYRTKKIPHFWFSNNSTS